MCVELIKNLVESEFNLQLKRKTRKRDYVEARAIYYMLLREKGRMTVASISSTLDKNHATVLHSIKNLNNWMLYDTNLKSIYDSLEKKVNELILKHPEEFGAVEREEEFYVLAYNNLEAKHRMLRGRYAFLLHRLKQTSPKTYETFKQLEANDI